jgi:uncharacterized protein (TIGR02996 family)
MAEERAFLQAILEKPGDDGRKLVYADWLEEQADPRAEYLRLMMQVRQQRVVIPDQRQRHQELSAELADLRTQEWQAVSHGHRSSRQNRERQRRVREVERDLAELSQQMRPQVPVRLQELAATLDPTWLAVVSDTAIEGCGKSTTEGWLRFDFVCDKTWADLKPTDERSIRHCGTCSKSVYFCDNLADARQHAQENHCLAVDLGIIRREGDLEPGPDVLHRMIFGMARIENSRVDFERDLDPVSLARLDARKENSTVRKL